MQSRHQPVLKHKHRMITVALKLQQSKVCHMSRHYNTDCNYSGGVGRDPSWTFETFYSQILCPRIIASGIGCILLLVCMMNFAGSNTTTLLMITLPLDNELLVVCILEKSKLAQNHSVGSREIGVELRRRRVALYGSCHDRSN